MIIEIGEEKTKELLSNFFCEKDKDVESFLREKAVLFNEKSKSRTYLILNKAKFEEGVLDIIAYFSLALKVLKIPDGVSKEKTKKLDGLYKNIENLSVYLIGQLAKNDVNKDMIKGSEILDYAKALIFESFRLVGGRILLIETSKEEKLISFYQKNGFELLTTDSDKDGLIQLVRIMK